MKLLIQRENLLVGCLLNEIDDEEYGVSEEDKKLNREFYKA